MERLRPGWTKPCRSVWQTSHRPMMQSHIKDFVETFVPSLSLSLVLPIHVLISQSSVQHAFPSFGFALLFNFRGRPVYFISLSSIQSLSLVSPFLSFFLSFFSFGVFRRAYACLSIYLSITHHETHHHHHHSLYISPPLYSRFSGILSLPKHHHRHHQFPFSRLPVPPAIPASLARIFTRLKPHRSNVK